MWARETKATYLIVIPPKLPKAQSPLLSIKQCKEKLETASVHTPVVYFYCPSLVFTKSLLYGQPMCNSLYFEHISFSTVSDFHTLKDPWGGGLSLSIFVAFVFSNPESGKKHALN